MNINCNLNRAIKLSFKFKKFVCNWLLNNILDLPTKLGCKARWILMMLQEIQWFVWLRTLVRRYYSVVYNIGELTTTPRLRRDYYKRLMPHSTILSRWYDTAGVVKLTTVAFCSICTTTGGVDLTTGEINSNPIGTTTAGINPLFWHSSNKVIGAGHLLLLSAALAAVRTLSAGGRRPITTI